MLVRSDGKEFKGSYGTYGKRNSGRVDNNDKKGTFRPRPIVKKDVWYEVEKVVAKKLVGIEWMYLVKWAGYSSKHNSWIDTLPPFFTSSSSVYTGKNKDSDEGAYTSEGESVYETDMVSDSDDSGDEWVDDSALKHQEKATHMKGRNTTRFDKTKNKRSLLDEDEDHKNGQDHSPLKKQKRTATEKMVVKALLALSAVVASGCVDSDSD
jgi:hypothetical protein